ncbi:MAG: DEAD/DEAH box helicase [Polyangiaceae bacterium]|nr:DEAD/DEAH box helicase [Polyangiaceae bacterium]
MSDKADVSHEQILSAVRKACAPGLWSQGVKLAREGAVTLAEKKREEVTLRVRERGRAVAPTVILYPLDDEWDCDCGSRVSPCNHVAAAAIALGQLESGAPASGTSGAAGAPEAPTAPAPAAGPSVSLRYDLKVQHGALSIERFLKVEGAAPKRLDVSLVDRIARSLEPRFDPSHDDIAIDRIFYRRLHGDVPLEHMRTVLEALAHHPDVHFDGAVVRTSGEWIYPDARVDDGPKQGAALRIVMPAGCDVLAMGVGRVGGVLRPLAETNRFGLRFEKLPIVRDIAPHELGTLATEILPDLERTMNVTVNTKRIPSREKRILPRVEFELSHELGALHVLPLLVYGDPARARIDAGKLVLLAPPAPVRDEDRERQLVHRLRDELEMVPGRRVRYDGREAAKFASKLEAFRMREPSAKTTGEGAARRELIPRIVVDGTNIDVVFELPAAEGAEARRAKTSDVAAAYREGVPIVALEGGGFAHLPAEFLVKHGQAILDLVASRDEEGAVPKTALPVVGEVADALGVDIPALQDVIGPLAKDFAGIPHAELPPSVATLLRPYQREGADWLSFLRDQNLGGLLADDMGLGKTLQLLSTIRGPALVVCPRSVVHNWATEIRRFRPDLEISFYEGTNRQIDQSADVTLTTYAVLRNDIDRLADVDWTMVVLDEAQNIKNPDSQSARAAFRLRADARFCLTGTPVENRLEDLWSLMRFSNPGLLGPRRDFLDRYATPIVEGSKDAAERLRRRIRPFLLRRTKEEVLTDLPPRTESVLYCELTEEERALYSAVLAATRKEVVERLGEGASVLAVLEALLRLRQAACHSGLLPGRDAQTSSKVERLVESLDELAAEGRKALVFSQWTSMLDRIEPHLRDRALSFSRLDGSTRDRGAVVQTFQDPGGPPVMLLSLKAGGVGLNLTAADHVFLLDPWWNPAVEEQAADRAHRIGQDKPVMVYRLVAKDTVEERILALQETKRHLADVAISAGSGGASITKDDLLGLLAE